MEQRFIDHMAATGDATYAATKAGYTHPSPRGSELARKPGIMSEVAKLATLRLDDEAYPAAVEVVLQILSKDTVGVPWGVKSKVALAVIDRRDKLAAVADAATDLAALDTGALKQIIAMIDERKAELRAAIDVEAEPLEDDDEPDAGGVFA